MNLISSPENCSGFSHGPRSRPTTRSPASVNTFATVAPDAPPAPTMSTSTGSGFVLAVIEFLSHQGCRRDHVNGQAERRHGRTTAQIWETVRFTADVRLLLGAVCD